MLFLLCRYMPQVMNDGVVNQINNPEVEVDFRKPNSVINQEILHLKLITNKLKSAYVGVDVEWIDTGSCFFYCDMQSFVNKKGCHKRIILLVVVLTALTSQFLRLSLLQLTFWRM